MQSNGKNREPDRARIVEGWVKTYSQGMFGYAATRMGNGADAEDVVQETFIKAYRSFDRFQAGSDAKSWLYQILLNTMRDHFRRANSRGQTIPIDDANQTEIEMSALMASPEALAEQKETMTMLGQALTRLPEQLAAPFMLREIADQSYKEIASRPRDTNRHGDVQIESGPQTSGRYHRAATGSGVAKIAKRS